ncbi:unnamed protein product [Bursaphelenchus xylophilus]|uniref:Carboxylic ester hydrolase n=1 Tax=Bursaphelenchus xylophilus TaxID=6326 RepID=C5IAX1_BURXY|nr:acetylcholinesterase [Bursaphelenchus xylophilus]ACZ64208.1 acetylcholinesterase 2 [Bursaphelenchus xylophilus]CAD5209443.1 unnamed protein product [Bursaphelenchus xylophilus]CAG9084503.1 unnamed protein product [Bursaphelenchus xylophilus]
MSNLVELTRVAIVLWFLPRSLSRNVHHGDHLAVRTSLGVLRGVEQTYNGRRIRAFLGVPYAKKPTGSRRFSLPEMVGPWEGEMLVQEPSNTCYYTIDTMFPQFPGAEMWNPPNELSEDCLSLNIWVPEDHDGNVMVWIFGGGFVSGSPSLDLYDGRVLAVEQRSIIVNINYRLGSFGFLYFGGQSLAPGNMGLMDQQLAFKWVHHHIGSFGGDRRKVTLFGESAGGASVTSHLFAPGSADYFQRIIINSGAIINNWATKSKDVMLDMSLILAKRLNCTNQSIHRPLDDVQYILDCMRGLTAHAILREADMVADALSLPLTFPFVPVDDDENFFKGSLIDKIKNRDFKKDLSVLLGTMKDEGTYWLPYYLSRFGFNFNHTLSSEDRHNQALISESQYRDSFEAFLPYFGGSQLVRHALMHAYERLSESEKKPERLRDGVARFVGDYFFTCSIIEFADFISDNVFDAVFMYYFTRRATSNPWPKWMGAMHGYEIEYFFGLPKRLPHLYNQEQLRIEQSFSKKIMDYWGEFSRGNPPASYWPKYNRITRKALVLSEELVTENSHHINVDVHGKQCRLIKEAEQAVRKDFYTDDLYKAQFQEETSKSGSNYNLPAIPLVVLLMILQSTL